MKKYTKVFLTTVAIAAASTAFATSMPERPVDPVNGHLGVPVSEHPMPGKPGMPGKPMMPGHPGPMPGKPGMPGKPVMPEHPEGPAAPHPDGAWQPGT